MYKSEEVLPEDLAEPVKVVKGKSFQDIVSVDMCTGVEHMCGADLVLIASPTTH